MYIFYIYIYKSQKFGYITSLHKKFGYITSLHKKFGYITSLCFCKKSLMVIKNAFIWSKL